ncbi:MAG: nucleotidyltransferase domain-containing protein [Actinomycetota bacterium]
MRRRKSFDAAGGFTPAWSIHWCSVKTGEVESGLSSILFTLPPSLVTDWPTLSSERTAWYGGGMDNPGSLADKRAEYAERLEWSLHELARKLSALEEVRRVSLFGSYARGGHTQADLLTDLDVLVVMDTDRPFISRLEFLYSYLALPVDMDLLCYTPREFEELRHQPFLCHALSDEVVVYEKKSA